ncbi:MAG: Ribosomal RNA large subunit methyltransferase E [Syntrophorhabdus sp. PtaB.Bin184]|jgi:23S rRNA (uridine2552-2'-O)-methyltransferase|nr:MAG: Ribosomal RNA large subunit methyltransferase E [Syntrophorhabdus sp. PtaB.Bin184]
MARFILKDPFYKKAKQEGFRARSAYKLKEIEDRFHLLHKGDVVLDLGCSPGSFLQVLSGMVGEKGTVIGIDILPTPPLSLKNITTIQADIRETDVPGLLSRFSIANVDTVTCDIAPNLSGIREVDDAHIEEIFICVLKVVDEALKPGGHFVIKSFSTGIQKRITAELQMRFRKVSQYKPAASRSVSSEVFFVCVGKKTVTGRKSQVSG